MPAKNASSMDQVKRKAILCLLLFAAALPWISKAQSDNGNQDVPNQYQRLYQYLGRSLRLFDRYLYANSSNKSQVTFGAELLPANGNRGTALLNPRSIIGVRLTLDRFKEMGIGGVTVKIGYPLFARDFPHSADYVIFFKKVADEIKKHGMVLEVEQSVIFANTGFSEVRTNYSRMTLVDLAKAQHDMAQTVIRKVKPDYLDLGSEPDTEFYLTGIKELNTPGGYATYVGKILNGLDRGKTLVGAGGATWDDLRFAESLLSDTSVDFIATHVYPVSNGVFRNLYGIAQLAKKYNKKLLIDEAWLYKTDRNETGSNVNATANVYKRDLFSFWQPLDEAFLSDMAKFCQANGVEYFSPFWTGNFFSYIDYSDNYEKMSYKQLTEINNKLASANIVSGKLSPTGQFYKSLISGR